MALVNWKKRPGLQREGPCNKMMSIYYSNVPQRNLWAFVYSGDYGLQRWDCLDILKTDAQALSIDTAPQRLKESPSPLHRKRFLIHLQTQHLLLCASSKIWGTQKKFLSHPRSQESVFYFLNHCMSYVCRPILKGKVLIPMISTYYFPILSNLLEWIQLWET